MAITAAMRERVRQVESKSTRTVHFVFEPQQKCRITPFTRKYLRLLDGSLNKFEEEEQEKFSKYILDIENESLEGGNEEWSVIQQNPIVFEDMPFYTVELTGLTNLAFQVADDPFYKS